MKKKENDEIRITPDALISLVVTEAEERELASMPSLKEMNAQFHPSEQFQKKMDRLLKKAHRKERWLKPEELAGPAVFLASEASDAVNGHILYVDGGILAYIGKQPQ